MSQFLRFADFPKTSAAILWIALAVMLLPASVFLRFHFLENAIIEPHPIRQTQTGLAVKQLFEHTATVFDYRSPLDGKLWAFVYEFPSYQWIVANVMRLGVSLEVASRLTTLFFFLVGSVAFGWLCLKFLGRQVAMWGMLFYWILPFNVVYSRTCLVDFTGLAFELTSLVFATAFLKSSHMKILPFLLMTLFGIAACTTKVMIWHSPTAVLFVAAAYLAWKQPAQRKNAVWVLASLVFQLAIAVLWIRWTTQVRGDANALFEAQQFEWIVGSFSRRLDPLAWATIVKTLTRWVMHDWLFPVFLVAILSPGKFRLHVSVLFATAMISVLSTFNVHVYHDYYFMGEIPYLVAIAAIGMIRIFELKPWARTTVLSITGVILLYRLIHLPYVFGPLFYDFRKDLQLAHSISEHSTPADLVYVEAGPEQYELPLYADRLVILSPRFKHSGLKPSVFFFKKFSKEEMAILDGFDSFRILGESNGMIIVRTRN